MGLRDSVRGGDGGGGGGLLGVVLGGGGGCVVVRLGTGGRVGGGCLANVGLSIGTSFESDGIFV